MFKPNARFDKVVASGSGWYKVHDLDINFPYGFKLSPLESSSLEGLFETQLIVQVGELDYDPNASALRHNDFADAHGLNTLERANHFFNVASQLAEDNNLDFNWELFINSGVGHDYIMASEKAADLIFN